MHRQTFERRLRLTAVAPVLAAVALMTMLLFLCRPKATTTDTSSSSGAATVIAAERGSPRAPEPPQTTVHQALPNQEIQFADIARDSDSVDAGFDPDLNVRIVELQYLGMNNDPDSLRIILLELENVDPRIRSAAIDAAVQFGSRDAVPSLEAALDRTADPGEKTTLRNAIRVLKLPSPMEGRVAGR